VEGRSTEPPLGDELVQTTLPLQKTISWRCSLTLSLPLVCRESDVEDSEDSLVMAS
jgi:hypothetical protein